MFITTSTASYVFLKKLIGNIFNFFLLLFLRIENSILLPKLFLPTVRKTCSSDRKKLLKFQAEGRELSKSLRSLEQFV